MQAGNDKAIAIVITIYQQFISKSIKLQHTHCKRSQLYHSIIYYNFLYLYLKIIYLNKDIVIVNNLVKILYVQRDEDYYLQLNDFFFFMYHCQIWILVQLKKKEENPDGQ